MNRNLNVLLFQHGSKNQISQENSFLQNKIRLKIKIKYKKLINPLLWLGDKIRKYEKDLFHTHIWLSA